MGAVMSPLRSLPSPGALNFSAPNAGSHLPSGMNLRLATQRGPIMTGAGLSGGTDANPPDPVPTLAPAGFYCG